MEPQIVANFGCAMAECPRWHETEDRLYWTDMLGGALYRYDPSADDATLIFEGDNVGGLTIQADNSLLCLMEDGSVRTFADGILETRAAGIPDRKGVRFHDAVADPTGRVLCGTIGTDEAPSRLYLLDTDGSFIVLLDERGVANGVDVSPDCETVYLSDTGENRIDAFDYDVATGELSRERVFVEVADDDGSPDGLTVDADGHVWVAHMGASSLVRYDPDGKEVDRVTFPTEIVTSVRFGGAGRSDLYVTTGDGEPDSKDSGAIFRLEPDIAGSEAYRSDVSFD